MKKILCSLAIIIALVCVFAACKNEKSSTLPTDENPQGLAFCLKDDGTYAVEIGNAKYLSKIKIPATYNGKAVTEVGRFCDETGNTVLQEIIIPNSVTTIGDRAFYNCDNLASVTVPDSVTIIGEYAFSNCDSLMSVMIPDSVITIDDNAFFFCFNLKSVTIGDSVTTIGDSAFFGCANLTSVIMGDSVTTIGDAAFSGCTNLTSVTIPDSVTTIGSEAFWNCSNLTDVYYTGSEDDWEQITIGYNNYCLTDATIHYNYVP